MANNFLPRNSSHCPRYCEIPRLVSSSVCAATLPRRTGGDFVFLRLAILGRAALHHVADVNVFSLQPHGFDHLRQQFSGAPDERQSLRIFIGARTFADKDEFGLGIPVAEDNLVSPLVQLASRALAKVLANPGQRVIRDFVYRFEQRRSRLRQRQRNGLWSGWRHDVRYFWQFRLEGTFRQSWFLLRDHVRTRCGPRRFESLLDTRHHRRSAVSIGQADSQIFVESQPVG